MALNPSTNPTMAGRITAPDASYPYGSSKNETSPGAGDGTPYFKARADDIFGFQQALLNAAGIVPSGSADAVGASQYLEAIQYLIDQNKAAQNVAVFDTAGVTNWSVPQVLQDGLVKARVTVIGGGGGGARHNTAGGGGGGGGGVAKGVVDLTGETTVSVTVGDGGAGKATNSNGDNGESSSFGAFLSAEGGAGGFESGSAGGSGEGIGGDVNDSSQPAQGSHMARTQAGATLIRGGNGGGNGGRGGSPNGSDAPGFGGGGGGAESGTSGDGKNGIVIVEW